MRVVHLGQLAGLVAHQHAVAAAEVPRRREVAVLGRLELRQRKQVDARAVQKRARERRRQREEEGEVKHSCSLQTTANVSSPLKTNATRNGAQVVRGDLLVRSCALTSTMRATLALIFISSPALAGGAPCGTPSGVVPAIAE